MPGLSLRHVRQRLVGWIAVLVRVDRWPQRARTRLEQAREVLAFALRRAREVQVAQVAGGLTFTTTLSIVPLLAVALSVFAAFPMFAEYRLALERQLLQGMLPPQLASTILRYLHDFSANAAGLTALGLVFLLVTALLMIHTVDRVLNDIWRVQARRSVLARVLVYWTLLTLGPLAIGASLSATSYVFALSGSPLARSSGFMRIALDLAPFVLGGLALAVLYVLVPNRKVAWHDALIGGFVASAIGEALSYGFGLYIRTGTLTSIYGAFSALPLFLLWVYLSWYALLLGAAIAATLPMLRATRFADERRAGNRFVTAAGLLRTLLRARQQRIDDGRMEQAALASAVRFPDDGVERLLLELERLNYVTRLDGPQAGKWLLTCDVDRATLLPLFARLAIDPANSLLRSQPELGRWLEAGLGASWLQQPLAVVLAAPTDRAAG
ncbi:MAG: YihY family inner membrane protein [Burkholderiales bacterium]|jgi:membrane protein|nr:YihY family inner membrane protein [Burkholderiales bacterium]